MQLSKDNVLTITTIALVTISVVFYTWTVVKKNNEATEEVSPAQQSLENDPLATYTDLNGNLVILSDFVGEVLIVNSWASWCPACVSEMKELTELYEKYKNEGVKVIGINRAEPGTTAQSFLKFINAEEKILLVLDASDKYYKSIGGILCPKLSFMTVTEKLYITNTEN